jgi:hypothetical protein
LELFLQNPLIILAVVLVTSCQKEGHLPFNISRSTLSKKQCKNLSSHYKKNHNAPTSPPYHGTIFLTPELITSSSPSSFKKLTDKGQMERKMFDRRPGTWVNKKAHIFDALFGTETTVEVQVNPEFNKQEALVYAKQYSVVIGQLPAFLFRDLQTVWIHNGNNDFGGGNNNLLIHVKRGEQYIADRILEETFLHEGTHTSLDSTHNHEPLWGLAQENDTMSISSYGLEFPEREDLAETLPLYLALRFRPNQISPEMKSIIQKTIPNRIAYLDCLQLSIDIVN